MGLFNKDIQSDDKKLKILVEEFQENYGDILDWIFKDLKELESLGYSTEFINISKEYLPPYFDSNNLLGYDVKSFGYDNNVISSSDAKSIKKYKNNIKLRKLAHDNFVTWKSQPFPDWLVTGISERFHNPFIEYTKFQKLYFFLERLYFIRLGHKLIFQDLLDVYFSGLDENLTFNLDNFNYGSDNTQPTIEFFQKINELKYLDKTVETFEYKSRAIIRTALSLKYRNYGSFGRIEEEFLAYLAGCSAVKHDRNQLTIEDYLTAYKTYYKLLKTDVTQYKAKPEIIREFELELSPQNDQGGYLICGKCGGCYKLQPGETPDDFSDFCDCGGKLEFKETLKSE